MIPTLAATGRERFQSCFEMILSSLVGNLSVRFVTNKGMEVWPRGDALKGHSTKRASNSGEAQEPARRVFVSDGARDCW